MLKYRITQTTPCDIPGTLVYWCQRCRRNSNGGFMSHHLRCL